MATASYELTREDLAAFVHHHQANSPGVNRYKLTRSILILCLFSALPLLIFVTSEKPLLETARAIWPLIVTPIVFVLVFYPYIRWRTRQVTNRFLNEGINNGFYGHCELKIGEDGLSETRASGSTNRTWSSVEQIVVTPNHLFIYTSGLEAFVVPRTSFTSDVDFHAFVDEIAQRSGVRIQNRR